MSDPGIVNCVSYAKIAGVPTFVLGGLEDFILDDPFYGSFARHSEGKIMTSQDGRSWTTVYRSEGNPDYTREPSMMIWDPVAEKFYCEMFTSDFTTDSFTEETWSSPDGIVWTRIEVTTANPDGNFNATWNAHTPYKHTNPLYVPGQAGLGDGEFGIDKAKKDSTESFPLGHLVEDGLLIIIDDQAFGGMYTNFVGGIWARIDKFNRNLEASFDSGRSWQTASTQIHIVNPDSNPAALDTNCMFGAPRQGISSTS